MYLNWTNPTADRETNIATTFIDRPVTSLITVLPFRYYAAGGYFLVLQSFHVFPFPAFVGRRHCAGQ